MGVPHSLTSVRKYIGQQMETLPGILFQSYSYVPDMPHVPAAFTRLEGDSVTMQDHSQKAVDLAIVVLIGDPPEEQASMYLDDLVGLGDDSVSQLFMDDPTLGGTCERFILGDGRALDVLQYGLYSSWGYEWEMTVDLSRND